MLHDARQILSPPPVMTGSGWDVHGTPDNTLTHDTHGHTPDTGTSVVSQLDHAGAGGGHWPITSQGWGLVTNQMRRDIVKHSRVKQGAREAREGQERTGAGHLGWMQREIFPFPFEDRISADYCSACS